MVPMIMSPGSPQARFADRLIAVGAIKLKGPDNPNGFRLKLHDTNPDAPYSPFFANLRNADNPKQGPLTEVEYVMAAEVFYALILMNQLQFDAIAPLPRAGDPFGKALCELLERKGQPTLLLHLEKEDRPDGTRCIEGAIEDITPGLRVLILDDLITQADSKLEGVDALEAQGAEVVGVLVLIDREQGGRKQLTQRDIPVYAAYLITVLLAYYYEATFLSEEVYREAVAYLTSA